MENYLTKFKQKHSFTDDECKKYSESDIIYDIDLDMPKDALEQWDEYVAKNGYISFARWTGVDNGYTPKDIDTSGMDDLKSDLINMVKNFEKSFDEAFASFYSDDSESDWDDSDFILDNENDFEKEN